MTQDEMVREDVAAARRILDQAELAVLMALISDGDEAAFARFYALTAPRLLSLAGRLTRRRAEAEDLLQDVYATIWFKAGHYSPERGKVMPWVLAILHNRFRDRVRVFAPIQVPVEEAYDLACPLPSPHVLTETGEDGRRIAAALATLPARMRDAILLAYFEGAGYPEIAARTGVPLNTVKSWVRRGLARLRTVLEADVLPAGPARG